MKRAYWILIIITIIGLLLRFLSIVIGFSIQANLDISLFPDEAYFLVGARYLYMGSIPPQYLYYHNSLILTPLITGLYALFGITAFAGRFISIIMGALTIPVTYFLGKELFRNEQKALLSALFLSTSFIHRFWTMRALTDGPLCFFFILSIYLFVRGINSEDWRLFIIAAISTTVTILIKYPGILIYFIIFFHIAINIYLKRSSTKIFFYYLITIGIFAFLMIMLLLSQFAMAYQPFNQISNFINTLLSGKSNPLYYILYSFFLDPIIAFVIFILLGIITYYSIKQHKSEDILLLTWLATIFIFFSLYGESELYRYFLPALPGVYLLLSHFLVDLTKKFRFSLSTLKFGKNMIYSVLLVMLIVSFINAELIIGEDLIIKRSKTYGGIYQASTWLNYNGTPGYGIMAPSNSLSQLEFYTNNKFRYLSLTMAETSDEIWAYIQTNHITYIILSEHFPETLSFAIYTILPTNTTHYTLNFTYSDGKFMTSLYIVK
ncbi:MAG: ArnT family glycosyltransferase [Candidatus Helarchaeota archaeon]